MQAQNAFNDNVAKFMLVPLGAWLVSRGGSFEWTAMALVFLQVIPFILLAPTAGWLADRYPKNLVLRGSAWAQLVILGLLVGAMWMRSLPLALGTFFLLSVQSAVFGPAKMGVVKELVGSRRMAFGSGLLEGTVILAILGGQVGGSWWFDLNLAASEDGWLAGLAISVVILGGAVLSILMGYGIQRTGACSSEPFRVRKVWAHFRDLKVIWESRTTRLCAMGVAFFWGFATFINLVIIQLADDRFGGGTGMGRELAVMLVFSGGGVGLGSILAGVVSRRQIELGLTPLGGVILTGGMVALGFAEPGPWLLYVLLGVAGLGAAVFLVPLHATVVDRSPADKRGAVVSALTLMSNVAGGLGALMWGGMHALGWEPRVQFLVMSVVVVAATVYVLRLLPREFVRLIVLGIVRMVYRIEVFHGDRMPEKGGVLLTPNHVSFVDVFILSAASPRPVRFLMIRDYFALPGVGHVARMFDSVPISATRAKDAIRVAGEALAEGSVVCIFPEGQLSRSGMLNEIKNGFGLIARQGGSPVLPVYMDGVWGSIFSCERGKFFWKRPRRIPYGMRVSFGEPLPAKGTDGMALRYSLNALAGETLAKRKEATGSVPKLLEETELGKSAAMWWEGGEWRHCTWRQVRDYVQGLREARELVGSNVVALGWVREWGRIAALPYGEVKRLVVNALQLAEPGDLGLGRPVLVGPEAPEAVRRQWGLLLPALTRTHAVLLGEGDGEVALRTLLLQEEVRDALGGAVLREQLLGLGSMGAEVRLVRFDGRPQEEREGEPETWAGLCEGDFVVSVSMPHTTQVRRLDQKQLLWKAGAYGRLLPGFAGKMTEEGLEVLAAGGKERLMLPGVEMDGEGFVWGNPESGTRSPDGGGIEGRVRDGRGGRLMGVLTGRVPGRISAPLRGAADVGILFRWCYHRLPFDPPPGGRRETMEEGGEAGDREGPERNSGGLSLATSQRYAT